MGSKQIKIVVIDDNKNDVVLMREMFNNIPEWDVDYHGFTDYKQALQELAAIDPSLIMIDYILNETDGLEVYQKIRNSGFQQPVVMVTGQSSDDIASQTILSGVEDYISKNSITPDSLKLTVLNACEKHKLHEKMNQQKNELEQCVDQRTVELATANLYNKQIVDAIPSILICLDGNNRIFGWNNIAEQVFGLSLAEVANKDISACSIPWSWHTLENDIGNCRESKEVTILDDISFIRSDGNDGTLSLTLNIFNTHATSSDGILIIGTDLTERKSLEYQLNQSQKLEAIGRLAAGIAHEITTPTQFISDNTRYLINKVGKFAAIFQDYNNILDRLQNSSISFDLSESIQQIKDQYDTDEIIDEFSSALSDNLSGIERLTQIIKAMRELSHPGSGKKVNVDINHSIENTVTITKNEWKYVAEVKTDLDQTIPCINTFTGEIEQVLINMIVNASHAIADVTENGLKGMGVINISTRYHDDYIEIQIRDTGCGIPEKARDKIFDPFFTTKEIGRGTGQGLAIAYDIIVNKMKGAIDCESETGHGTTFTLKIPCEEELALNSN